MDISYFRTAKKSYMIVKNAVYDYEEYRLQMVLHNDVPGLLPIQVIFGDGEQEYWFEVTGMQSLERHLAVTLLNSKLLRLLMQGISDLKQNMDAYFLDDDDILYSADMIYYDRMHSRFRFCYIPGNGLQTNRDQEIGSLLEFILQHVDHSDQNAVQMAYNLYEQSMDGGFTIEKCRESLQQASNMPEPSAEVPRIPSGNACFRGGTGNFDVDFPRGQDTPYFEDRRENSAIIIPRVEPLRPVASANGPDEGDEIFSEREWSELLYKKDTKSKRQKKKSERKKSDVSWWESRRKKKKETEQSDMPKSFQDLLEEVKADRVAEGPDNWGQTVCFSDIPRVTRWKLQYMGDGLEKDFILDHFPFYIGKDAYKVDGVLKAESVSRVHAKIYQEEDGLYLEDENSTNATYLNGSMIYLNTGMKLNQGDHIVFATEEYVLRK